jgi:competence protein ComEC
MHLFRRLIALIVLLGGSAFAQPFEYMRTHFIDVNQGNAILLEFPCGAALIDSGGRDTDSDGRLYDYLDKFFKRRTDLNRTLDVVFITHTHIDHNRALRQLVEDTALRFTVKSYVHNGILEGSGRFAAQFMHDNASAHGIATEAVAVSTVRAQPGKKGLTDKVIDPISCPGIDPQIRILSGQMDIDAGWTEGALNNGNNHSLVIRVDFGLVSFLFTGDLEEDGIETLLDYYKGTKALDVDVYQVGHHGSYNGTTPALLTAMSPRVAVISMSQSSDHRPNTGWAYGHPREKAVLDLAAGVSRTRTAKTVPIATGMKTFKSYALRKAIFATGWDGNVVVYARSDGQITVRSFPN